MEGIFKENEDYYKSAFLNWRVSKNEDIKNLLALAESFLDSSIELIKSCLKDNSDKKADGLIFAILTNANHGIELYLKAMIWTFNSLIGNNKKFDGGHNIKQLLQTLQCRIKEHKGQKKLIFFNETNKDLIEYINELFKLIDGSHMDFSRYPISTKGENHFYVDSLDNVAIDLENVLLKFSNIKESLDERASYFFYQVLNGEW